VILIGIASGGSGGELHFWDFDVEYRNDNADNSGEEDENNNNNNDGGDEINGNVDVDNENEVDSSYDRKLKKFISNPRSTKIKTSSIISNSSNENSGSSSPYLTLTLTHTLNLNYDIFFT
jgi:hypothetical protein